MLAAAAVASLPDWARRELGLPKIPVLDRVVGEALGTLATSTIRWAMVPAGGVERESA